jgi:predicted DNA-binding protein
MRTTIELSREHRARLVELAARRGEKGFSKVVREALDHYLNKVDSREDAVREALGVLGSLDEEAADHFLDTSRRMRETWR